MRLVIDRLRRRVLHQESALPATYGQLGPAVAVEISNRQARAELTAIHPNSRARIVDVSASIRSGAVLPRFSPSARRTA